MKLLHTGDLHLDSPFAGESVQTAETRRERQRQILRKIFALAKEETCDMILIAGDLFDGKYVTPETGALCRKLFCEAKCPVILAPGNHDPYAEGSFYRTEAFPDHVYVFNSSDLQCFDFEELGARVYGYAFLSSVLAEAPLAGAPIPEEDGMLRILCAHGDRNDPLSRYAPLPDADLRRMDFDYCALGHVHNPSPSDPTDRIRYCGFPEGRSYDETGEGGVWVVELEKGEKPFAKRVILSENRYLWEEMDVSQSEDVELLTEQISGKISLLAHKQGTHLRLTLTGNADPTVMGELLARKETVQGELAELCLIDRTVPYTDGEYLERDTTLRGAFYRSLYPKLVHEDVKVRRQAIRALQIGLAAIDQRRIPEEEQGE